MTLTYDLNLQSPKSYGHDLTLVQKYKVNGQLVSEIEWKQTDGLTDRQTDGQTDRRTEAIA